MINETAGPSRDRTTRLVRAGRTWDEGEYMSSSGRTRKAVLCIGNDPVSLNLRCSLLREHGWTVVSSGDGNEGAILFRNQPTGAAVLDLNDDGVRSALIAGELKRSSPAVRIVI